MPVKKILRKRYIHYHKDGTTMRTGYFKNEKRVGKWTTFDKSGRVAKVTQMKS